MAKPPGGVNIFVIIIILVLATGLLSALSAYYPVLTPLLLVPAVLFLLWRFFFMSRSDADGDE